MGTVQYTPKSADDIRTVSLYGGKVTITYRHGKHTYTVCDPENGVNGLEPSVTQILKVLDKPALVEWAARCCSELVQARLLPGTDYFFTPEQIATLVMEVRRAHRTVSKVARDIGSESHDWIAAYLSASANGEDIPAFPENPLVKNCCFAAKTWITQVRLRPVVVEQIVYSRRHRFLGTLDAMGGVFEIEGCPTIVDWKSSKALYAEYRFQLAAYKCAYEEMTGTTGLRRYVVKLGKNDGVFEVFPLRDDEYGADLAAFLGLMPAAKRMKELEAEAKARRAA